MFLCVLSFLTYTFLFCFVLKIENVITFCCDFLFSWLDESNILEMHHLADLYGLQQLNARVHSYILRNIQTLSRTDAYRQLPQDEVFRALSSDELEVNSENEAYEAALHYHYSPEQVETDQVFLQVSPKVCTFCPRLSSSSSCTFSLKEKQVTVIRNQLRFCYVVVSLSLCLFALLLTFSLSDLKDSLKMLEAVRFCLMEKQVLLRLYSRLNRCPLRESVSAALYYHDQEIWQPIMQSPLTQPRSHCPCILGFGGMYSSSALPESEHLFQVFHADWGEWRTLTAAHPTQMSNQGVAVLNNFVYLIGGDKNNSGFRAESRCWR